MKQKLIPKLLIIISIIITALLLCSNIVNAQSGGPLYLGLKGKSTARATGTYEFNNKNVFKIVKYNQSGTVENDDGTVIYCLKAGPGFGSESYDNTVIGYTQYFDIKNPNSITGAYRNQLPSDTTTYNELVWVLDHIYNPNAETMDEYLERAGIWSSSKLRNGSIPTNTVKDIVEVVEQVAIWYFTNPSGEYHNPYTNSLELKVDGEDILDKYGFEYVGNEIDTLYAYLVEGAINAVRDGYTYETNTANPVTLNSNTVKVQIEENNYIIGPYTLEKNNDTAYTLSATVTDGTNDLQNVKILNQNMNEVTLGTTLGDKINSTVGNNFYISVPISTNIEKVKLTVSVSTRVTTPLMWTVGENELSINQPVVVIDTVNKNYSSNSEVTLPKPTGSYDLELLKQDSSNKNVLANAVFNISINGGEVAPYTTKADGKITINGINITDISKPDTITITEITAPNGYVLNNTPITLTVNKSLQNGKYVASSVSSNINDGLVESGSVKIETGSNGVNTVKITVNNSKTTGSYNLRLLKQDAETKTLLENVAFTISINGGQPQTYTTNSNGEITINGINITNITNNDTITITEIRTPNGYVLNNTPITLTIIKGEENGKYVAKSVTSNINNGLVESGSVTITQGQDGINTVNITINNTKITGSYNFKIIKEDTITHEKLGGAIFAVKVNDGEETQVTTNENGEISINNINITDVTSPDIITLREIKAPDEYSSFEGTITLRVNKAENDGQYTIRNVEASVDDGTQYDDVRITNNSGALTVEVTVPNEKVEGSYHLKIIKQDENDQNKKLQGAIFMVKIYDEDVSPRSISTESNSESIANSYTTDANGEINITNTIYNENRFYHISITEITPPTGYDAILTEPIELEAYSTIKDGKYALKDVEAISQNANWSFDEETNTIIITITNKKQPFDLALRKYITHINGTEVTPSREPQISDEEAQNVANGNGTFDEGTTAEKDHTKTPLVVKTGDIVRYTIRIYNEGKIDGYAKEITDYLPEGLELVPASESSINAQYGWTQDGRTIKTTYLADKLIKGTANNEEENGVEENSITENETNSENEQTRLSSGLDYQDVQVECRVVRKASDTNISLKNVAEITDAEDILGGKEDIDSTPNDLTEEEKNNYNPGTSEEGKGYEDDDDYEELVMLPTYFDLSLRKFITGVNDREITNREPQVDTSPLLNGKTTANYNHTKDPVEVKKGDEVTYTIRVYNEGEVDGYVEKIVDHLPPELEFLPNDELNKEYGWTQTDERTIETDYLRNTLLKAFDGGNSLDYADIKIKCKVKDTAAYLKEITNIAEITEYRNDLDLKDRDNENKVNLPSDEDLPNYRDEEIERGDEYIPGQEDDDDFEKVILKQFDLALRKFITGVNEEEITSRVPQVDTSKYGTEDENGKLITSFTYNHTKDPVRVCQNDIVIYTIRIYNEGQLSGYAEEIKDDVPEGLIFLPENEINQEYRWVMYDANGNVTENAEEAVYIRTDYLSKAQEETEGANLIQAFDKNTMETPDYKDVKVAFRVTEPNTSDRIIINKAEISEDADENGDEVEDIDSTPDEWIEGEDDQDIEKIYVQYFDLALRKWVSQVILIEDGQEKVKDTGHYAEQDPEPVVRVDLNQNRIDNTIIKFKYQIRITNEGEIAGAATEISDYIPDGLEFNQADNPLWKEVDGKIVTDQLKNTILQPGESAVVEVILTWVNDEDNMGVMINTAEISEDYNESGTPDIDSVPNNKVEGEDDIDTAPVALTMVTGSAPLYIGLTAGTLAIIAGGVFLIKKYVI